MNDKQTTSPRISRFPFLFLALFGKEFHLNLYNFVWRRHVGALLRGTNMAAVKQQNICHWVLPLNEKLLPRTSGQYSPVRPSRSGSKRLLFYSLENDLGEVETPLLFSASFYFKIVL